jgi:hypothetical protein
MAYGLLCPLYPPSLFAVLRRNAALDPDSVWNGGSWIALLIVVLGWAGLWVAMRGRVGLAMRFGAYLGWVWLAIPFLHVRWGWHFVHQAGRYKSELELAMALTAGLEALALLGRTPALLRAGMVLLAVGLIHQQTIRHRRFARNILEQKSAEETIEYRVARWIAENRPGETVFAAGSVGQWLNAFSDVRQFTGGSFPTAPNLTQQKTHWGVYGETDAEKVIVWMRAYGVDLLVVPGRKSAEFWKPFARPEIYEGKMELLWRDRDTAIYEVPRESRAKGHVVAASALARTEVEGTGDVGAVRFYEVALRDALAVEVKWLSRERAELRGSWRNGEAVSLHWNGDKGWRARQGGSSIAVGEDALGQMVIWPRGEGVVELVYERTWEWVVARTASLLAILAMLGTAWRGRRERIQSPLANGNSLH